MIYCLAIKMIVSQLIQIRMDYFDNKTKKMVAPFAPGMWENV
jgi:hypothetical protein